jgi:O-antigen ligase
MLSVTILVAAFGWFLATRHQVQRLLLLATMGMLGAGVAVSQSRSAIIALAVGVLAVTFARSRRAGLVALSLVGLAGLLLTPVLVEWRVMNTAGTFTELGLSRLAASDAVRLDLVLAGPKLFIESPIFGVGLGGFLERIGDASHNWYSVTLAEQGLVGVTLVTLLVITLYRALRYRPTVARSISYGVLAVLATGALFLEPTDETQWSVPAVIIVTGAIVADWRVGRASIVPSGGPQVAQSTPRYDM